MRRFNMNEYKKFFKCDYCKGGTSFSKVHSFNVSFREVNFTDELIYDVNDVIRYECKQCSNIFTEEEIKENLKEIIRKYKEDYWEKEIK